jgi:hypothetical protein
MNHALQPERKGAAGGDAIATVTLADDPALSAAPSVGVDPILRLRWPAFLVDLLPQGHARGTALVRRLAPTIEANTRELESL